MRVYIYEDRVNIVNRLCKDLGVSPTKLVNELITNLEETIRHNQKAKDEDDLPRRIDRR